MKPHGRLARIESQRITGSKRVADSGLYQLVIELREARVIGVGKHGRFMFPSGFYVYTGSGKRRLESRIERHLRSEKKMRWHIDYLLRYARVIGVTRYGANLSECKLNLRTGRIAGSEVVAPGFGSSDCNCVAHLFHFRRNPLRELD